ncbi:hypothetical protein AS181_22100 [Gordonia sp. SGD-V-85]|nr:hypothetical protein AS181_22100 [Gordonia sp. SGD-V-85]
MVPREARETRRELQRLEGRVARELARIDATAEVQQERVRALNSISTSALVATAQLSQAEVALAQLTPHASGRLAAIADLTAVLTSEIVVDSARELRRGRR